MTLQNPHGCNSVVCQAMSKNAKVQQQDETELLDTSGMTYPGFRCPSQLHSTRNSYEQLASPSKFQDVTHGGTLGLVVADFLE